MPYIAYAINVMIASPGDVQDEHDIIRKAIDDWNAAHSSDRQLVLISINWKTHATPQMGDRAQGIINKQLLDRCDLLIAVFWTRIGTPTGEAEGGTVEEIKKHLAKKKPAMIYFSNAPVPPAKLDTDQYQALTTFKKWCEERGLVQSYGTLSEFSDVFGRQLAQTVSREFADLKVEELRNTAAGVESDLLVEIEGLMPDVIQGLRESLKKHPLLRDILYTKVKSNVYSWPGMHLRFSEDEMPGIRDKLKVLANYGLLGDRGDDFAYKITEDFVRMLRTSVG